MGESVIEATILTWHKKEGDTIHENEILLEVATDKVDSDVPSPVSGQINQILHREGDVVPIGSPLAILHIDGDMDQVTPKVAPESKVDEKNTSSSSTVTHKHIQEEHISSISSKPETLITQSPTHTPTSQSVNPTSQSGKYFSPLVLNIARVEGISMVELDSLQGTGSDNRVTKDDILSYVETKKSRPTSAVHSSNSDTKQKETQIPEKPLACKSENTLVIPADSEIIAMDRMRKLIAKNMIDSKRISAHVSSFVEADVTNIVTWRNNHKASFQKREGYNLTFMPVFVEAVARAIKDFPMINVSVDGENIIKKRNINIGIATALPNGNLIVPVIKNADNLSLVGLAAAINELANKARMNKLNTTDIEGGTYTISNIGTFGNILGTPIIPQPQVAILAVGAIVKKPVVIETPQGDVIGIRHRMYLSHTYDHRVVDGALGGKFVKRVADYLASFDVERLL
jgi:2-oxoglutarate dehydrogenase E2 component (dihydrolipoamide succinyltransferase)